MLLFELRIMRCLLDVVDSRDLGLHGVLYTQGFSSAKYTSEVRQSQSDNPEDVIFELDLPHQIEVRDRKFWC